MGKGLAMRFTAATLVLVCGLTRAMPESDIPGCSASAYPANCYAGNNSEPACSGRGNCVCGQCVCNERESHDEVISGPLCECTNFLCNRFNGLLCGGPDHGTCVCDKCVCKPGWTGPACMCEDSSAQCINPESGRQCSGNGICECNQCKCYEGIEGRYSGKYCEDCPICKGKCSLYKECVQCQAFQTGKYSSEQCVTQCTSFNVTLVSNLAQKEGERLCVFFDENDCRFKFVYGYDNVPVVRAHSTLECPPSRGIMGFASLSHHMSSSASVVVALLTLSLALLMG